MKVTLDRVDRISKYYSTPGSSTFINGVLDKIVASLTEEGRIKRPDADSSDPDPDVPTPTLPIHQPRKPCGECFLHS